MTTEIVRIPFHGTDLLAVEIDGRPHVVLKPAIEALGLDFATQLTKLRRRSWAVVGQSPTTGSDGKTYQMATVDVRTFLMLLATIDEKRVSDDARPLLVAYQKEVADVIEAYWTRGGVINPRATGDQIDVIIRHAEGQARVLRLLDGIVGPRRLEAYGIHLAARVMGEEPELPTELRPLTTGEYLEERGLTPGEVRRVGSVFGKRLKAAYITERGEEPEVVERFVGGTTRRVAGYTEADRPLFDEVWDRWYAADYDDTPMALIA